MAMANVWPFADSPLNLRNDAKLVFAPRQVEDSGKVGFAEEPEVPVRAGPAGKVFDGGIGRCPGGLVAALLRVLAAFLWRAYTAEPVAGHGALTLDRRWPWPSGLGLRLSSCAYHAPGRALHKENPARLPAAVPPPSYSAPRRFAGGR